MTQTNAAAALLDHALSLRWDRMPAAAQTAAKAFLLDSLCVGVAGARSVHADAILRVASGWGAGDAGAVLGRPGIRLPTASAAFVNAFQIHAQEFDCVHEPAVAHPLATVLAALMAEAERSGPYDGETLLAALAAGVDVVAGLGLAAPTPVRFFRPATAGIFGSVAALARLRGLPLATALNAFGFALAFASGTMQAHVEGKAALPVQVANAARGAINAMDLALEGVGAAQVSLDGPFGYLPLFEERFDLAPILADLGRVFRIAEVSWKPFPTGRAAHGAIVATQALMRDQGLTAESLDSLTYRAPPLIKRLVGRRPIADMPTSHARLCFPWLAAVVLTRGTVGLADFDPASLGDPALHALAERVSVEDDGSSDPAAFTPGEATARLKDGRTLRAAVETQLGSPSWPLTRVQQLDKALACLTFGGIPHVHEPLAMMVGRAETLSDVSKLFRLAAGG